jgi:hypothetical protein
MPHDLACVREAFLFDLCQLYPHKSSWTFQLIQLFRAIDVKITDVAAFPRHLSEFEAAMGDVKLICFHIITHSEDKTLSFFRIMPDIGTAASFRSFLSTCKAKEQNLLLLFLTSGLRWRFFQCSSRGSCCPLCQAQFWSWEHFLSRPMQPVRTSVPEFVAMVNLKCWHELAIHVKRVVLIWLSLFGIDELRMFASDVDPLFV